jgi:hypothetical protein
MLSCNCQMMTKSELDALFQSDDAARREEAIGYVVGLLTSMDAAERRHGYELFGEGVADALFRSCLNYGSLTGGFTDPLVAIVKRTVEAWAASRGGEVSGGPAERP